MNHPNLELAKAAARGAGVGLLSCFGGDAGVVDEQGRDVKARADEEAESVILEQLRPTGIPILAEESGAGEAADWGGDLWVVDPLDGTFNFVRGLEPCCVSIGFWSGGEPVLGVVYDFVNDEMYSGVEGEGMRINGERANVSAVSKLGQAALATGFPSGRDYGEAALGGFVSQVQAFKKIRMLGSAAMSLAHVAAGRVEAYREESIWFWDVAAGLALVRAAGGAFEITKPDAGWQMDVYAHNGVLERG